MSNIPERCKCYSDIFEFVKTYAESLTRDGESIDVSINDLYRDDIYISIDYDTIVNKKHISKSEHLSPYFLNSAISRNCVKLIIDDIVGRWREHK